MHQLGNCGFTNPGKTSHLYNYVQLVKCTHRKINRKHLISMTNPQLDSCATRPDSQWCPAAPQSQIHKEKTSGRKLPAAGVNQLSHLMPIPAHQQRCSLHRCRLMVSACPLRLFTPSTCRLSDAVTCCVFILILQPLLQLVPHTATTFDYKLLSAGVCTSFVMLSPHVSTTITP